MNLITIDNNILYILGTQEVVSLIVLLKLSMALMIGKLIGRERKRNYKPGGSRTFSIICLGATLLSILSLELVNQGYAFDFVRLLAYGMASLGFATSGIIRTYEKRVDGLTTASMIWLVTIIGFLIGMGLYTLALISSGLAYMTLESKYKRIYKRKKKNV